MSHSVVDNGHRRSSLLAAVFLMATSAIGPGFITQTASFTESLGASFAFGIVACIVIDFVVQLSVWRICVQTRLRAADVANAALPGSGQVLALLVMFGGLVFNVGNIAGAGLGLNALLGISPLWGGAISALIAIGIFLYRRAGKVIDRIMLVMGVMMIVLTLYVAFRSQPPIGEALTQAVWPSSLDFVSITTIVGGSVGGYITYAGAHRLLDHGVAGSQHLGAVTKAAFNGVLVTGIMRFVLFLAILGVVASGVDFHLHGAIANPAGQAFQAAAGEFGLRAFGLIMWAAGITSVMGAAYTSVSFVSVFKPAVTLSTRNRITVVFILVSLAIFVLMGKPPAALLVFAGGFNGLILPLGLTLFVYVAWRRQDLMGSPGYSRWLLLAGILVCLASWYMAIDSFGTIFAYIGA